MKFTASLIWPLFCIAAGVTFMVVAQHVAPVLAEIFG
jgi:hypothetical protein